ncbi:MAG: 3-dehydroquinate dehydratase [Elusimicrobia bacterium CG06_land_8_20_14_3_00_38_11]|nr:MAG: 3-dehydroquinate dehydratase [Elusimicrobia bacterium CG06_land_8_20_14_3_00_38_11]
MIKLTNLTKKFKDKIAVDDINLEISSGEIFGILGPNGAGKTTTIKMISGLLKPTSGNINVCGFDIQKHPISAKKIIGLLPDTPFVYQKLTGREFLEFICGIYEVGCEKIDEYLELFELKNAADELVESYSHGMQQKLVLAGILIRDPKVILLDEPLVGLDPKSARLVKNIYNEQSKKGTTIFLSTHILELAEKLCSRLAIIDKGKIIALGTLDELKTHTETEKNLEDVFFRLTENV